MVEDFFHPRYRKHQNQLENPLEVFYLYLINRKVHFFCIHHHYPDVSLDPIAPLLTYPQQA